MREDVSGFQTKIESAIEEHKSQMDQAFKDFSSRFENKTEIDEGFKSSILEHLRLAKDEGARITAQAVADAEKFDEENRTAPEADFSELRDAISEISKQESQADILKSLVEHASKFTPRGAFFIVKNDHFVGWRVFGKEEQTDDQAIRDVFFPVSDSTVLSQAANSLETAEGSYSSAGDEAAYLNKLDFGQPDRMYAIPLIARGRSVAVLYADYGQGGTNVNVEAIETLVQIAGLTVELLAASRSSKTQKSEQPNRNEQAVQTEQPKQIEKQETASADSTETISDFDSNNSQTSNTDYSYQTPVQTNYADSEEQSESAENFVNESGYNAEPAATDFQPISEDSNESKWGQSSNTTEVEEDTKVEEIPEYSDHFETESYQPVNSADDYSKSSANDYQLDNSQFGGNKYETPSEIDESQVETVKPESTQFETFSRNETVETTQNDSYAPVVSDDYSQPSNDYGAYDPASSYSVDTKTTEAVAEPVAAPPVRTRFSDRNVDLPIEVNEDERRLHNDARRFARLLVSEIKLYNEQKVKEGRESHDVYERLREAIDRSREMYDKRVQSPVSAKFDYFHYELVNSLGDGDEAVLGDNYPGASI